MGASTPHQLGLLVSVNARSAWRRMRALGQQSRLLTGLVAVFLGGYLVLAFALFYFGLRFLSHFPGLGTFLTERLMFLLFAFLFVLLLLSNWVISYTNLFRNRETAFLLCLPIPAHRIFQWKFIESALLASWAFVFLIAPLLAAYGIIKGVPWHFYPVTVVLVAVFIVLPAVAGAILAVQVARYLDRRGFQVLVGLSLIALLASLAIWWRPAAPVDAAEARSTAVLDQLLARTKFAESAVLPSHWLSSSVLQWADGALMRAGFFAMVLTSYAAFFGMLALTQMGGMFYDAASAVQSRGGARGVWGGVRAWFGRARRTPGTPPWLERFVQRLPGIPGDVGALMVKDIRAFWRDTAQWAQSLVLFGLLGVYIFNLRHFTQQLTNPFWVNLISYLNLGACSLNLATLTTRFVYPQFSLEGKRLWIVGMAPLGLVRVVKTKFWLATVTSLVVTLGLILTSCHLLDLPWDRTVLYAGAVTVMTFTLNGLAVGLGALYPNFKEDNPSKIVSGFGGTFCLVLSFLYILGAVSLLALATPWTPFPPPRWHLAVCVGGFLALSLALGLLPLRLGLKRVRGFEH